MTDRVWPHFQTMRRELKIQCIAEYFWWPSRCLEIWSNTVLSVWYIFSIKTHIKEKMKEEKQKKSMLIKIRYQNTVTVMISFVWTQWIINEFEKYKSQFLLILLNNLGQIHHDRGKNLTAEMIQEISSLCHFTPSQIGHLNKAFLQWTVCWQRLLSRVKGTGICTSLFSITCSF